MKKLVILIFVLLVLNVSNAATITSVGTAGAKDWSLTSTWIGGILPAAADDVVINANVFINFSSPALGIISINNLKTLTVNSAGTLNFSSIIISATGGLGQLTLSAAGATLAGGNITNNGNFLLTGFSGATIALGKLTNNGSINFGTVATSISLTSDFDNSVGIMNDASLISNLVFAGTALQKILGTVDPANNITVNTGAIVQVESAAVVNLYGVLTLTGSGTFDADGPLTPGTGVFTVISSTQTAGGRIASLPTPANFTGDATVQHFIHGKLGGDYRYLSIPITNGNAGTWKSTFGITGSFTDPSTTAQFPNVDDSGTPAGNTKSSVYEFNNATQAYVGVGTGLAAASTSLDNLKGYSAYDFNDAAATASYTGLIRTGDAPIAISSTSNNYNLIPNPYPSPISWANVTDSDRTGLNAGISVRTANSTYATYSGGFTTNPLFTGWAGEIAIGQSFWAQSSGGSTTFTLKESHKTLNQSKFVRIESPNNYVRITLSSLTQKDETVVRFHKTATEELDGDFDVLKTRNGNYNSQFSAIKEYLNISSFTSVSAKNYAINTIPEINSCSMTLGIKISDAKPGDYSLTFSEISTLDLGYKVILIDNFINKETTVSDNFKYPFSITSDAMSLGDSRFKIRFETDVVTPTVSVNGQTLISNSSSGNQWYKDGFLISGATESTFEALSSGVYYVETTTNGCRASSSNISLTITGIDEVSNKNNFIYPNPTNGKIIINMSQEVQSSLIGIYVYDALGNTLISSDKDTSLLSKAEKSIDLSNFRNGVYIVNLTSGQTVKSIRVIKK